MSAVDAKNDSTSAGDDQNMDSTTSRGSPTANQPFEKSAEIGSGDAKNLEREGNLVSSQLQNEEIIKITEYNPSVEHNTVALSVKSLTTDSVIEISSTSTSQDLDIELDTKTVHVLELTKSEESVIEKSLEKIEVEASDDKKQTADDTNQAVDDQNDSFDDEINLKWDDDDESDEGLSEDALKLLDQELGIDDIMSTNETESKTDISNEELKAKIENEDSTKENIEGLTLDNEKNEIKSQELPNDDLTIEVDEQTAEVSTPNKDLNVSIEQMDVDLTVELNIDNKTASTEKNFQTDIDSTDNTGVTEKDSKLTSLIVEEVNVENKDMEDSSLLTEIQTEDVTKTSDNIIKDNVENQNAVTIDTTQVFDIVEMTDDTKKQDLPVLENDTESNINEIKEVLTSQIEDITETDKVQPDNTEKHKESKGMKTDLGLNKPDVMLEIPTQELIDIDEFDDTFDDKEMHSIEKEADSYINTQSEDSLTKITEDKSQLSVTDIVKKDEPDKDKESLIIKAVIHEKSSETDLKLAVTNTVSIDTNPIEEPLLIGEQPSTSKDVIESLDSNIKSLITDIKSKSSSDLEPHDTESKSLDANPESPNPDPNDPNVKSIETTLKLDEQPSTSKADDMSDEPEAADSLLAESSRVMDDDDDHDEERDDDSDDFDQDDESSNHMTAEQSEESNPTPSESEAVEKDDECEKETAALKSEIVEDNDEQMDIVDDIVCEENDVADEAGVDTTMLNEDSLDFKSPSLVDEATEPESQAKERDGTTPEKGKGLLLQSLLKDGEECRKESPRKSARRQSETNNAVSILSYVDLEDSDEDIQEANKEKTESKADEQDDSIDITKDEETVVKTTSVYKMTKLNTSEVSIKTGASTKPPLIIPEITNTSVLDKENANKQADMPEDVVFFLDSDSEDEKEQEKDDKLTEGQKFNTRCMNPVCTSDSKIQHYAADATAARYYGTNKKRGICETCREFVIQRNKRLINDIKNQTPLLELDLDKPNALVEISDSEDSEDDIELFDECNEPIGQQGAILSEKIVDMINGAWVTFNMDDRLKYSENCINEELQALEDEGAVIKKLLEDCQLETDRIRKELYDTFHRPSKQLPPLAVVDTPVSQYTCLERDAPVEKGGGSLMTWPEEETSTKKVATTATGTAAEKKEDTNTDKQDDDRDVSVVYLSAEAAPTDLPPAGDIVRPPLRPGLAVHAMRNAFGSWLRGKILDIMPKTPTQQYTHCRVKFDHNMKNPCKVLPARCIAFQDPCNVRMTIGTRVLALFRDATSQRKEAFYSGVVAEIPNPVNNYRYLVFFDDGYAQYVKHQDTRLVCESKSCVWDEVHPFIRDFVRDYLLKYPERPMVRLHAGQRLNTEWNGKWWSAKVLQVDASLAHVHFEEDNRTEWIYRGSTRLAPLYLELQAAGRSRTRLPRSKAQFRSNMPYVEYMRSEEQVKAQQQDEMLRSQRAVAKKSTTPSQAQPAPVEDKPDSVTSRVVYYTPKNAVKPKKMVRHNCGPQCKRTDVLTLKELRTYNPLAKPLLSGWERLQVRFRGSKTTMYRAPCGRRLRNIKEVHKYLRLTDSELPVDLFDFNVNTHCLAEFVLHKYNVMKKDLSHGKENVPVPCVNYHDDSLPEFCSYNTERTPTAGVPLNIDPDFLCGCDCEDDCEDKTKCACWKMTLEGARTIGLNTSDVGYVYRRLPDPLPSGIYECNSRCKCKSTCLNRVAQQPLQLKLQVFKTLRRGWGIRALNDVPKGSFLCVYAGNLLTDATANLDGLNEGDEYLAELDYIEVVEQMKEGFEEDIPEADKKLDKQKESKNKESEGEDDEATESDEEQNDSDKMDDDFQPGFIGMGLTDFDKRLRKRNKKKQEEEKQKEKEGEGDKTDGCITISDDEEMREPSRFTAQAGMGDKGFISRYKSVRTLFGEDEACYIMDAKVQGNIGRYLNHSCQPNVFVQNVFVDTHDPRFPWVAFFALAHIRAGTELTWNYNYDIGSVPGKVLYCYCGARNCRGRLL